MNAVALLLSAPLLVCCGVHSEGNTSGLFESRPHGSDWHERWTNQNDPRGREAGGESVCAFACAMRVRDVYCKKYRFQQGFRHSLLKYDSVSAEGRSVRWVNPPPPRTGKWTKLVESVILIFANVWKQLFRGNLECSRSVAEFFFVRVFYIIWTIKRVR